MIVNTEPAGRDVDPTLLDDIAEALADSWLAVVCWMSVEVIVGEEVGASVADPSSVLVPTAVGGVVPV